MTASAVGGVALTLRQLRRQQWLYFCPVGLLHRRHSGRKASRSATQHWRGAARRGLSLPEGATVDHVGQIRRGTPWRSTATRCSTRCKNAAAGWKDWNGRCRTKRSSAQMATSALPPGCWAW